MFPIEKTSIRQWIVDVFPEIPFGAEIISTAGAGPYEEGDFDSLIRDAEMEVYDIVANTEVLIIGDEFPRNDHDRETFAELLDNREGAGLRRHRAAWYRIGRTKRWFTGSSRKPIVGSQ